MLIPMENYRYCFTGGGTGGHVYPAKPVIDLLLDQNNSAEILWIGSLKGMEKGIVEPWNITYRGIPSGKLRRYFSFKNFLDLFRICSGFFKSRRILKAYKPQWIFSKGGFVSVPPVFAARSLGIPVYSHDSDLDPGLATKLNAARSRAIFIPYEESRDYYSRWKNKVYVTGNPVRRELLNGDPEKGKSYIGYSGSKPILLVLGGSSGAEEINGIILKNLDRLCERFFIVHQMGADNFQASQREGYRSYPYIYEELSDVLAASDLAFSRAGASALWELALTQTPMVLLPLTIGSRGDQMRNARLFESWGIARVVEPIHLTDELLWDIFENVHPGSEEGQSMKRKMLEHPFPVAAEVIFRIITGEGE